MLKINIADIVGQGYGTFWRSRHRYRVVKGSRASKKSKTTALWFLTHLMLFEEANVLVVRKTFRTLKDSCFAEFKWAAKRLNVGHIWKFTTSPLEITNTLTGQKIFFRGLDDPLKITSIAVGTGYLCWMWIEEAYEIMDEHDFDMLDESIRGELPPYLFKQTTLTLNPWNEKHWIKKRFFDTQSDSVLALTTDYRINEYLDEADKKMFDDMRIRNPRRYQVAGLGNWGTVEGMVYENWVEDYFTLNDLPLDAIPAPGLDYGYTNDPTAFVLPYYSPSTKTLYIWDEFYEKGMSNSNIYKKLQDRRYHKLLIVADSSEPKSNAELRGYGLKVVGAKKGRDSVKNGIQFIRDLRIVIHPRCVNFLTEINNYGFEKDKFGKLTNEPIDDFNHLMDALRYGMEKHIIANTPTNVDEKYKAVQALGL